MINTVLNCEKAVKEFMCRHDYLSLLAAFIIMPLLIVSTVFICGSTVVVVILAILGQL
ncbi:MAG: hypothetical protein GXZ14_00600 [Ruminococcaceae bacterium]|jgi:hypothetical protein|nr:hypothetical protein [Oscillospiraceae bacterium]